MFNEKLIGYFERSLSHIYNMPANWSLRTHSLVLGCDDNATLKDQNIDKWC